MSAPELHTVEIEGTTRAQFILRGALATGAVYGVGAIAPFVSGAFGATASDDVEILSFALALEQLETAFYKAALANAGLTGDLQKLAAAFGAQEAQHANALSALITQLGSKPAPAATAKFGLTDQASFLKLAVKLEDTGVGAYNGAAPLIKTPEILGALGAIVQTEARHSSALRMLAGQDPAPQAFDKGLTPTEVNAVVQPFVQQS
jgi:rubrerythrin